MSYLDIPNCKLYYEYQPPADGSDAVVTLINGYTRSSSDFRSMKATLEEHGFGVLTFDNRGSGQTLCDIDFLLSDMAEDVARLWDHLAIKQSSVLGISMGGVIAQIVAHRYQANLDKLVLVSTTSDPAAVMAEEKAWGHSISEVLDKLKDYFSDDFTSRNPMLVEAMAKGILRSIQGGNFVRQSQQQRHAYSDPIRLQDGLASINSPSLVIHGSEDKIIPASEGKRLAEAIGGGTYMEFSGAGHLLLAERPKELYAAVIDFLSPSMRL